MHGRPGYFLDWGYNAETMEASSKALLWAISLSVVAVILSTAYLFLVLKNYDFVVEASCDPAAEEGCFYRDCSTGECPPNELEYYRVFLVSAKDFDSCSDNSCLKECTEGSIRCEEVTCDAEAGDDCTIIEDFKEDEPEPVFIYEYIYDQDIENASTTSPEVLMGEMIEIEKNATSTLEATI